MSRWAIIVDGVVSHVVIWDGSNLERIFGEGAVLIQLSDEERCSPGWLYDAGLAVRFCEPPAEEQP